MILFGLSGGLGNCVFALPAIKYFSRVAPVGLVVDCDYDAEKLFGRCAYIKKVYKKSDPLPRPTRAFACYSVPASMRGMNIEFVGWPRGTSVYERSEADQILLRSVGGTPNVDVTDWCDGGSPEKSVDVALIPCGKPGDEWLRKRWSGFLALAQKLEADGKSVEAFGQQQEIDDSGLKGWWRGPHKLERLPDALRRCRMAVANDCGPGHLASSLGVPTLMLFTATSPIKGRPVGPHRIIATGCEVAPKGCQSTPTWSRCTDWKCQGIGVDRVRAEVEQMLSVQL